MFIKKEKFDEISKELDETRSEIDTLYKELTKKNGKDKEFKKLVDGDYGDSIDYLLKKWGNKAWSLELPFETMNGFLLAIEEDIKILLKELIEKKEEE